MRGSAGSVTIDVFSTASSVFTLLLDLLLISTTTRSRDFVPEESASEARKPEILACLHIESYFTVAFLCTLNQERLIQKVGAFHAW